ncbi:SDR family oxidoreductase [Rhodococcus oxybenzonivorans]|uniref:SDR family NAD(P)-dependent oxidoreductase n=1 Tax=Rhodococcus oxybenzonivorans TaxID=1990687 RepID=UPI002953A451|nr:SDR family oxidoreductase [Rhodococcus oxybenzonivorans]MDV7352756.1 SDR family oxidoreductase [Rhodococcus oxybenzonivorans]
MPDSFVDQHRQQDGFLMNRFEKKVAFVTGGAQGFGEAFCRSLATEGASVVVADIDVTRAESTATELTKAGFNALAVQCDVGDEDAVGAAVSRVVDTFGGIDILVNNAGLHLTRYNQPFSTMPRADMRALFDVNVFGIVNTSIACLDTMRSRGGGTIVNISSIAAYNPITAYGVSKLTVRALTIALAHDFASAGVRCNAIAPGLIGTDSALADLPQAFVDSFIEDRQVVHRLGRMDDIVAMMLYLCADESSFITGETIKVSGGTPLWI